MHVIQATTLALVLGMALTHNQVGAANILDLMACPSPSHHIWHMTLVNALAARGHNVTVLSTNVDPKAPPNVTYIHMEGVYDFMYKENNLDLVALHDETPFESVRTLYAFGTIACLGVIRSNGLQRLLAYPENFRFDLVLYDYTLGPCVLGVLPRFGNPPLVAVTAFNNPTYTIEIMGGHNYYAYIPHFAVNYDTNMSFVQRIHNVILHAYDYYHRRYVFLPSLHEMVKPVFGADLPYIGDLERVAQIALVNSHPAIDFPEPLSPNVIAVGGLQMLPAKPLPNELETFIESAPKGAVLFSLGTNVRSDKLGAVKQRALLDAFAQMPEYNFLWKFESDSLPGTVPTNVMIRPWLPQNDILAHKKVKAFITHAGSLSTHEATWHGVPMVAIPFFVDQVRNSFKSLKAGVAEHVPFKEITTELVVEKLQNVLEDPSYRNKMQIRSKRFQDQPESPLQRAVWWIEYVLRNPDPSHLTSPVRTLGPFAGNMYDIQLVFLAIFGALILVGRRALQMVFPKQTRQQVDKSRKNK